MRDVDLHGLGRTVKHAIAALASRTVVHQLVLLAGTVALTRLLGPLDFGVFAIVQSALAGRSGQMRGSQPARAMVTAIMPADTAICR